MSKRFGIADIGESETDFGRWEVVDLQTQKRFALFETEEAASSIAQIMNCREILPETCEREKRPPEVEQSASGENHNLKTKLRAELLRDFDNISTLIQSKLIAPVHLRGWADMLAGDIATDLRTYAKLLEDEKGGQDATVA